MKILKDFNPKTDIILINPGEIRGHEEVDRLGEVIENMFDLPQYSAPIAYFSGDLQTVKSCTVKEFLEEFKKAKKGVSQ